MGTTGSGRLTDYPGSSAQSGYGEGNEADRCVKAFNVTLEDVERCDYFRTHGTPPATGTELSITLKKRVVAQTKDGTIVGHLPTHMNYLAACLKSGYAYSGAVTKTRINPVATVTADFLPTKAL